MCNVVDIGQLEAFKYLDIFMKCRYMYEMIGRKSGVFAKGIPVSNLMTGFIPCKDIFESLKKNYLEHFASRAFTF